ncbi:hypothetical protein HOY80DRAFT_58933 [Tuber brumale]|nr:hypothetical protein HOY80DRAFT_58933 [Tuber brumale]
MYYRDWYSTSSCTIQGCCPRPSANSHKRALKQRDSCSRGNNNKCFKSPAFSPTHELMDGSAAISSCLRLLEEIFTSFHPGRNVRSVPMSRYVGVYNHVIITLHKAPERYGRGGESGLADFPTHKILSLRPKFQLLQIVQYDTGSILSFRTSGVGQYGRPLEAEGPREGFER